jgi:proline iminopeptidase
MIPLKNITLSILKYGLLIGIVWFLYLILYPRKYEVAGIEKRDDVTYWQLSTGSKIAYTQLEGKFSKQAYPIIYLHGGPGGMITNRIIESLSPLTITGYDLYFYDQVGSGYSNRLNDIEDYSVERHQRDLEEIVRLIGAEKVILIAHSWGSMLATQYLEDYPDKVDRMIITGPGPILPIDPKLNQEKAPDSLDLRTPFYSNREGNERASNLRSKFIRYGAYMTGQKMTSDKEADHFFTFLNSELKKSTLCDTSKITPSAGGGGYYSHIMTVKSFQSITNHKEKLKDLPIPILLLRGQCDNQQWGCTKEYLDLFPNARLKIIKGAGHNIHVERPQLYMDLILEFLAPDYSSDT